MNKRLGCLSRSGILAGVVTLLLIGGIVLVSGDAIFSPGPLNAQVGEEALGGVRSHAAIAKCAACHPAPWSQQTMADLCLACHTGVTARLRDAQSLHGVLMPADNPLTCRSCHPEHQGPDASLTVIDTEGFPHEAVGYSLLGHQTAASGSSFTCADCHPQSVTSFDLITCDTCHRDLDALFTQTHIETFGQDCLACHDGLDTYGRAFDHDQLPFPLQGEHASLVCSSCHQGAHTITDLQAASQTCYACHQPDDVHQGAFGQDCAQCHIAVAWEEAALDHSLTAFPLTGGHTTVECIECHADNTFKGTPQTCYACHQPDDVHQGAFGQDCVQCHTAVAWEGATFDHSLAAFPLTGGHTTVECVDCHVDNTFQGTPPTCHACHAEPVSHAGLLGNVCADCHTANAWTPAQFNRPHTFPITHENHGQPIECRVCHSDTYITYTCYGCHEHNLAEVRHKHLEEGIRDFQNCIECHPTGREHEGEREDDDD